MKGGESTGISHSTLELHFNLEVRCITSLSQLVRPSQNGPTYLPFQEPRKYRHIKRDMGKPKGSPQSHVNIHMHTVVCPPEKHSVLGGDNLIELNSIKKTRVYSDCTPRCPSNKTG